MKSKVWVSFCILFLYISANGQKQSLNDTVVVFKVYGNCEICKNRIEKAAKGKGIVSATWDVDTKLLSLDYDPSTTSPEKVQQRIADAGHDTQLKKAKDFVYNELPDCCHYREKKETNSEPVHDHSVSIMPTGGIVTGVIIGTDNKGNFHPLEGASIVLLGAGTGVTTDSNGIFKINSDGTVQRLVVSYAGYGSDTISVHPSEEIRVVMASGGYLKEVKITARQKASYISLLNPIRTQVMTDKELFK